MQMSTCLIIKSIIIKEMRISLSENMYFSVYLILNQTRINGCAMQCIRDLDLSMSVYVTNILSSDALSTKDDMKLNLVSFGLDII